MNLYIWDKLQDKHCINNDSYIGLSENLVNWSYHTNAPLNQEPIVTKIIQGDYDNIFNTSKDILDIGACHGVYSIELTKNNKFNHAYAFEANKIYSRIIGINTILNNVVDKVDIINTYISNKNDKINYNGWSNNNENIDTSALASECYERTSYDNNYDQFKEVSTRTIDSYNLSNIGFIKIDVEGHELEVLQGALKTIILNDYPPILFEIWDIEKPFIINKEEFISYKNKIITLLESLGYEIQFNVDYDTHLAICKKKVD